MPRDAGETVLKNKHWRVVLAKDQTYLGRCIIILQRHDESLSDVRNEEWVSFSQVVRGVEAGIREAFGADAFNWTCMMNNAYAEHTPQPHVHWHCRPRYETSVEFAKLTFEDKEFGKHYDRSANRELSSPVRMAIIAMIQQSIPLP